MRMLRMLRLGMARLQLLSPCNSHLFVNPPMLQVKSWAGSPKSKYYNVFRACARAPWPAGAEYTYIMGGWAK
jgi:hypothetical protein